MESAQPRFIVDNNVGKLVKLLRLMGYDTIFFRGGDDSSMVALALADNRVILTRDTQIMKRRLVTGGRLKAILLESDDPDRQIGQVARALKLDCRYRPFSLCLECNRPLIPRSKEEVQELVPPYVFQTQGQYMQCPSCGRIYWKGTHWERMSRKLDWLSQGCR